jgi:hypothetical protein
MIVKKEITRLEARKLQLAIESLVNQGVKFKSSVAMCLSSMKVDLDNIVVESAQKIDFMRSSTDKADQEKAGELILSEKVQARIATKIKLEDIHGDFQPSVFIGVFIDMCCVPQLEGDA